MHPARDWTRRLLASWLVATHLLVTGLAVCPALHHWLHHDADEPDHQCAVTAMIDGQLDRAAPSPSLASQPPLVIETLVPIASPGQPQEFRPCSPGERAPPAC